MGANLYSAIKEFTYKKRVGKRRLSAKSRVHDELLGTDAVMPREFGGFGSKKHSAMLISPSMSRLVTAGGVSPNISETHLQQHSHDNKPESKAEK